MRRYFTASTIAAALCGAWWLLALIVPAHADNQSRDDLLITRNMPMQQVESILGRKPAAIMISERCMLDEPPYSTVVCGVVWYVPYPPNEMLVIPFRLEGSQWLVNFAKVAHGGPPQAIPRTPGCNGRRDDPLGC